MEVLQSLNVLRINSGPYGWRFTLGICLSGDRWVHSQVLDCACKHPAPEPNEAVSCSFYVYSLLCFSPALRSKACVWWIPCTRYTLLSPWVSPLHSQEGLECDVYEAEGMWELDTLSLTPTSHPASKTASQHISPASQHSTARKHTVFNEADLGSQVFLEATFSERKHLRICERKKKHCLSSPRSCFSHTNAYLSILLSYAACHLGCLQLISVNVIIELNQRGENNKH